MSLQLSAASPAVYAQTASAMRMHRTRCKRDIYYAAATAAATDDVEVTIRKARDLQNGGHIVAAAQHMGYAYALLSVLLGGTAGEA